MRWHRGPGQGGLRDPDRGRLPAGDRLLRVPARAEADRGPHVRGRPGEDALVHLRDRRVGRLRHRPAHHHRRHQGGDEEDPRRDPGRHLRQELDGRVPRRPEEVQRVQEAGLRAPAGDHGQAAAPADELGERGGVSLTSGGRGMLLRPPFATTSRHDSTMEFPVRVILPQRRKTTTAAPLDCCTTNASGPQRRASSTRLAPLRQRPSGRPSALDL
ncbi:hypothetical protein SGPA1_11569 [Streptomyces misionensis JCM 4497]